MSDTLIAALLAVSGTLTVGLFANFLAEDYRRFRDGQGLASALAGELSSRSPASDMIKEALPKMIAIAKSGEPLPLLKVPQPKDHVFENSIAKLGLLEPQAIEDVVYVYENVGGFRVAMSLAADLEDGDSRKAPLLQQALECVQRANDKGASLIDRLRKFSDQSYWAYLRK